MKKIIGILALIGIIMVAFVGCENKNQNINDNQNNSQVQQENNNTNNTVNDYSGEIVTEPFNKDFNIDSTLSSVASISGLDEKTKMSEDEIKANYNLGKYEGLQREIRSKITDDSITEIIIIKIGENEQTQDLFQKVAGRLTQLQQKYAENDKITSILNNGDNVIIKQQAGVLIGIIAENAKEIDAQINEQM